jgi:hypothetical protein
MKFGKKFFIVLGLVAILAAMFTTVALAGGYKISRFASVVKVTTLNSQPTTFRLLGSYVCTKVQLNSSVSGKVISIYAYDLKEIGNGKPCGATTAGYRKDITVGTLVPGRYTVLINPDGTGRAQKKFTFIAPMMPATATPAAGAPAPANP